MKNIPTKFALLAFTSVGALGALAPAAAAEAPTAEAITACFGGASDGALVVFSGLKKNMTPEEVGAIVKGADKVSKFGMAKVTAKDCAGAVEFEFYFAKDKKNGDALGLATTRIIYDSKLSADEAFYGNLVSALTAKYGKLKPDQVEKKLITLFSKDKRMVQLTLFPSMKGKQYQLTVGQR